MKAAKRDAWAAWRRRATQRRALAHLARRLTTRTARRTFNRWRTASAVADVLRAAALAADPLTLGFHTPQLPPVPLCTATDALPSPHAPAAPAVPPALGGGGGVAEASVLLHNQVPTPNL